MINAYARELAVKDLKHNSISSILITVVVAAICLPMIILASLREGYVVMFKNTIEKSSQAKRIDIIVKNTGADSLFVTDTMIREWKTDDRISEIIPNRTRPVKVLSASDREEYFELVSTLPTDPDLKRFGFQGQFGEQENNSLSVIIREEDMQALGFDSARNKLTVIVNRSNQAYPLEFNIIGTIDGGEPEKMYVPLKVMNYLEQWILGYGVNDPGTGIRLPASTSREEALSPASSDSCLVISTLPIDDRKGNLLTSMDMTIKRLPSGNINDFVYLVATSDSYNPITKERISNVEQILAASSTPQAILLQEPLHIDFNGQDLSLAPAVTGDLRVNDFLKKGEWLNTYNSRFEIVVPEAALKSASLPVEFNAKVGTAEIPFRIVGAVNGKQSFIDYEVLYRLHQVKKGEARINGPGEVFEPNEDAGTVTDRYLVSRVHARTLDDVVPLIQKFEAEGYDIFASSKSIIENFKKVKTILTNFVILITVIGGLACIASLFVLMYEAIKRKKNQIGILRAMGLSKGFINQIFIWQSLTYGWLGLTVSIILFFILKAALDSSIGHEIFDIPKQEGNIFQMSFILILIFYLSISIISFIAGRSASKSVEKIDPADILAD